MSNTLNLGNGKWARKKGSLLAYNSENNNYKPLPFTFDRASSATRVNKQGLIETVGADQPRVDYLNDSNGALLLEPSRTNLVTYSEDFSQSSWVLDDATIISNNAISPDGALNATLLKGNTNSSRHNLVISGQASSTGSFSIFVKAKELKYLQIASANTTQQYVNFDLSNGIIGTVGSAFSNAKLENYGNGWYRCIVVSANQFNAFYVSLVSGLNATWLESWVMPNNTDGLYIFGAQLEEGSFPTSYIKSNSGSAVTRLADECEQTVPDGVIGQTEGTMYAEIDFKSKPESGSPIVSIMTLNNNVSNLQNGIVLGIERQSEGINRFYPFVQVGNSTVAYIVGQTLTDGVYKVAFAYKQNDFVLYVNGVQIGTDNSGAVPTTSQVLVGERYNSDPFKFSDGIKDTKLYNTRLSNSELAALTQV